METSTHKRHSPNNGEHSSKSRTPVFEKYFGAYPRSFALRVEYPTVGHRPTERIHTYAKIFGQAAKYFSNAGVLGFYECSTFGECLYAGLGNLAV